MPAEDERERLRQTFDRAAGLYDRVRPDYPEALFDDLIALTGLTPGDQLLEVGCATGKATRPLARRGFRITCVELGAELAAVARQNLAGWPVEVVQGQFEEWQPGEPYGLVYAATAWHWIDPGLRYPRAWQALRPGGHLAIWGAGHVFPEGGDPFFGEIQDIYDEIGEGLPPGSRQPRPGELADDRAEIEASGLFEVTAVRHYDWERVYPPRSTSTCSTRSLATWPCRTGNGRGCTARSGDGSRCGRTIRYGGTGERCCRSPGVASTASRAQCHEPSVMSTSSGCHRMRRPISLVV